MDRHFGKKKRKRCFQTKSQKMDLSVTRSSSKLSPSLKRAYEESVSARTSQIFDIQHFQQILNDAHVCSDGGRLEFIPDVSPPVGLFHQNIFRCTKCLKETSITNFPPIHPIESKQQEPNKRLCIAAATTGIGYDATNAIMSSLCLSITAKTAFLQQLHKQYDALNDFAQKHFQTIIDDIKFKNNKQDKIIDITVSLDGTWKRRGHISNYGIVFLIDVQSGYCIDYEVMSLYCEVCQMKKPKLRNEQFDKWYKKHQKFCYKNYDGTSKSMEKEGAVRLFQRSLGNGLRYKYMVCDGDASAYKAIKNHYIERQKQKDAQVEDESESMEEGTDDEEEQEEESGDDDTSSTTSNDESGDDDTSTTSNEESGDDDTSTTSNEEKKVEDDNRTDDNNSSDNQSMSEDNDDEHEHSESALEKFQDLLVIKEDCINHVGKRVMKYLLKLKKEKTRQVPISTSTTKAASSSLSKKQPATQHQLLDDNQKWGGKVGRMTDCMMKKLSSGYGLAIRQASTLAAVKEVKEALDVMQQYCRAAFYHYMKTDNHDEEEQHKFCPKTKMTWCTYHNDKLLTSIENDNKTKKKKRQIYLDPIFRHILQPMIDTLTSRELLRRCLRAVTQNSNESLNSIVWAILSKSKHHGFRAVRGSAALAAIFFNHGRSSLVQFYKQSGIDVNVKLFEYLLAKDNKRISKSQKVSEQRQKHIHRKAMNRKRSMKAQMDTHDYASGGFNL
ncbi:unnamed protein product [Rotaria sp. Silwood1]|nr:unnamed protein product [Rotaria sp. Silwood1]